MPFIATSPLGPPLLIAGISLLACLVCLLLSDPTAQAAPRGPISRTALAVCAYRAIGAQEPDPQVRNPDHLAVNFVDPLFLVNSMALSLDHQEAMARIRQRPRQVYFFTTARTKHFDTVLTQELQAGCTQVVILGAGLDSRGLRFHEPFPQVRFFELDLPPIQAHKRKLTLDKIGPPPATLVYAPIDFNTQSLAEALTRVGYDPQARTFFIWEGVTYYLGADAVDATLGFIAQGSAPGSSVIFDYMLKEVAEGDYSRFPLAALAARMMAGLGEPYTFGLDQDQAADHMARRGLQVVSDLGPQEATQRYLVTSQGSIYGPTVEYLRFLHAAVPDPEG